MSFSGGIGRGSSPVPKSPTADNRQLQNGKAVNSIIKSAKWGQNRAGLGDPVSIKVELAKPPGEANAAVEVFFNASPSQAHPFDQPIMIPVKGMSANGTWQTKAPKIKEWTKGYFTFRVRIDNQTMVSDALKLTEDPVARAVRRISTDGFDG